jgi:ABC-type multidrug transport system fused ATPase/permease subunit
VSVRELELRVAPRGGRLGVLELVRFENDGPRAVYVPAEARGSDAPAFRTALPAGASDFSVPLGLSPEGLQQDGAEVRFYGPIYPSAWEGPASQDQGISFEYALPAGGDGAVALRKRLASGAERVVVLAPADAAPADLADARDEGELEIEGRRWRRFVLERVAPGTELAFTIPVPTVRADPDAVTLEESRIFLELDDAALLVREELRLTVRGDAPVVGRPGEPLLALHVPAEASDLRFDGALFERGLRASDEGDAVLDGPLPPGESSIEIMYHLPVADPDAGARFERRFDRPLPLLSIFVADTGLRFGSERLHRRRPVSTPDRTYLHLEAFQVEPSETSSWPSRRAGGGVAAARGAAGAGGAGRGAAVAFLGGPLRRARSAERLDEPSRGRGAPRAPGGLRRAARPRARPRDRQGVRRGLRGHAPGAERPGRGAAAQRGRGGAQRSAAAARADAGSPACPACGAGARPDDRFCAQLRRPPRARRRPRGVCLSVAAGAVAVEGLAKRFGPVVALAGLDFAVPAGHVLAVLGPNGAGKSTLLRMLAGLARPSAGRVRSGPAATRPPPPCAGRWATSGHATFLYPNLTARENLLFAGRLYGVAEPAHAAPRAARRAGARGAGGAAGGLASRAGRRSGSPSPAAWSTTRRWCCSTSPSPASTPPPRTAWPAPAALAAAGAPSCSSPTTSRRPPRSATARCCWCAGARLRLGRAARRRRPGARERPGARPRAA